MLHGTVPASELPQSKKDCLQMSGTYLHLLLEVAREFVKLTVLDGNSCFIEPQTTLISREV